MKNQNSQRFKSEKSSTKDEVKEIDLGSSNEKYFEQWYNEEVNWNGFQIFGPVSKIRETASHKQRVLTLEINAIKDKLNTEINKNKKVLSHWCYPNYR